MLHAYAPDVLVVDVEESLPISRPRTQTEDLTLQVHADDGRWHRRAVGVGGRFTACGETIALGSAIRHEEYSEPLCDQGCFTTFELDLAAKAEAAKPAWEPMIFRKDHEK